MFANTASTYGAGIRPLNIATFESASDTLDCVTYTIENFLQIEGAYGTESALERLFDYWSRQEGAVPSHFTPCEDIASPAETIRAIIDVRSDNPMDFVIADHKVCSATGRADGWRGMPLGKLASWSDYVRIRAMQYNQCRHTGIPAFYKIRHRVFGIESHFVALLLPVSGAKSGKTERIYSCVRRLSANKLAELRE